MSAGCADAACAPFVRNGERVDDLELNGLKIIQNPAAFLFGTDAVLLADFTKTRPTDIVLDLCAGSGIVPILLCGKSKASRVVGLEIQEGMADMANRSVAMNGLGGRITIINGDLKDAPALLKGLSFDAVTVNPPYIRDGAGLVNADAPRTIARHEKLCSLEDVITVSAKMLKPAKKLYMVHRPERLADIFCLMRACGLEPKTLRLAFAKKGAEPALALIEGARGGSGGLRVAPPLYMDGSGNGREM